MGIDEAGCLSAGAQAALRRTMERYMKTCRIILCCDSASKIIPPLRSRCLPLRVGAPTPVEIQSVLQKVGSAEGLQVDPQFALMIAEKTNRDLRRGLLMLETLHAQTSQNQ